MSNLPLLSYRGAQRGQALDTLVVDVGRLLETKLLATATSGGGKSQLIRQLLEQTYGVVPHIVVDPEGEFPTLRERFDYLVAARDGGDVVASVKTARVLCRKIVENGASIVIDLSEVNPDERREYVRVLLNELMSLPRSNWRDYIIVLDEAQMFAPEKGDSVATDEVMSLSTRGRKRGFCLVAATLRISQFSKDAAAPLLNRMIGLTGMDIDVKRAGEELGFDAAERRSLKTLDPGQFYVYGPAISKEVKLVRTANDLLTKSPPRGSHASASVAPPSRKVAALLAASFAELPKEADAEANSAVAMRAEIARLTKELAVAKHSGVVDHAAVDRAVAAAVKGEHEFIDRVISEFFTDAVDGRYARIHKATDVIIGEINGFVGDLRKAVESSVGRHTVVRTRTDDGGTMNWRTERGRAVPTPRPKPQEPKSAPRAEDTGLSRSAQKLLDALARFTAMKVAEPMRAHVAALAGISIKSSSTDTGFGKLATGGYITTNSGRVRITEKGQAAAAPVGSAFTLDDYHAQWRQLLGSAELKLFDAYLAQGKDSIRREDLANLANISIKSSATDTAFGKLITLEMFAKSGDGEVRGGPTMFPEGLT